ncbi:MAG: M4 family metallopeptidase [Pseudomonadota bacterium]
MSIRTKKRVLQIVGLSLLVALVSCERETSTPRPDPSAVPVIAAEYAALPSGVRAALQALPHAQIASISSHGMPSFISGNLGQVNVVATSTAVVERDMAPVVNRLAPALGGHAAELQLRTFVEDDLGFVHVRYDQVKNGLPVVNGEMFVSVDPSGKVNAAGGILADADESPEPALDAAAALDVAELDAQTPTSRFFSPRLVYIYVPSDTGRRLRLAWEIMEFGGLRDGVPVQESVYVDAEEGRVVQRYTHVFTALNRKISTFNGGTSYPVYPEWLATLGTEASPPSGDDDAVAAFDKMGDVYNCVNTVFGIDSFTSQGAMQEVAVHWGTDQFQYYASAYHYDGSNYYYHPHIALGDGGGDWASPQVSVDTLGHEFGHLIVMASANLRPLSESYDLHEHFADFFGAVCEAWKTYGNDYTYDANTWLGAQDIYTPGTSGDAARYMGDPWYDCLRTSCAATAIYPNCTTDGQEPPLPPDCWNSVDHYTDRWPYMTGAQHYNAGVPNLAFKLLVTGGTHPRRGGTEVTGIGLQKARQIWFRALTHYMYSLSPLADARAATVQSAIDLFGATSQERKSTETAWNVVGVFKASNIRKPIPLGFAAANKIQGLTGDQGAAHHFKVEVPAGIDSMTFSTTGSGDASADLNLYVSYGIQPFIGADDGAVAADYESETQSSHTESIVITSPAAGTWYATIYNRGLEYPSQGGPLTAGSIQVTASDTTPPSEVCDEKDQDSDGLVDENTLFGTAGKITTTTAGNPRGIVVLGGNAGGRMFVVGDTATDSYARIEKRKLANGALETAFDTDGIVTSAAVRTIAGDPIVVGTSLFITGRDGTTAPAASLTIEKRKVSSGALETAFGTNGVVKSTWDGPDADTSSDSASGVALASDGIDLYVVGTADDGAGGTNGLIEKRSVLTGALDTTFDGDGYIVWPAATVRASGIAIDNNYLYVIGWDNDASGDRWRIEKRWLSTGTLDVTFDGDGVFNGAGGGGQLRAIAIDESNMYLAGQKSGGSGIKVEARALTDGSLLWTQETVITGNDVGDIAVDEGFVYTSGYYSNGTYGSDWRIEARSRHSGALHISFDSDGWYGGTDTTYGRILGINGNHAFVAGTSSTNYWMFQKLKIRSGGLESTTGTLCPKSCTTGADCPSGYYCISNQCSITPPAVTCAACESVVGDQCVPFCTANPGICGVGTCSCTAPGPYSCSCPEGYYFNGVTCKPNVECTTDADCLELYGTGYSCYETQNLCYPICATPEEYCVNGTQNRQTCSTARTIARTSADDVSGITIAENIANGLSNYASDCSVQPGDGYNVYYRIYLFASDEIVVKTTSATFNVVLQLFQAPVDNCLAGCATATSKACDNNNTGSGDEDFSVGTVVTGGKYVAPANGWYIILADTDSWDSAGAFNLNVKITCPGGTCSNPGC